MISGYLSVIRCKEIKNWIVWKVIPSKRQIFHRSNQNEEFQDGDISALPAADAFNSPGSADLRDFQCICLRPGEASHVSFSAWKWNMKRERLA